MRFFFRYKLWMLSNENFFRTKKVEVLFNVRLPYYRRPDLTPEKSALGFVGLHWAYGSKVRIQKHHVFEIRSLFLCLTHKVSSHSVFTNVGEISFPLRLKVKED